MNQKVFNYLSLLLFGGVLVKIGVWLWGANKGFDIGDEGNYIYTAIHGRQYDLVSDYFWIISYLYDWIDLNIVSSRYLRVMIECLGSLILSIGIFRWSKTENHSNLSFPFIAIFCLSGTLLTVYARGFSYNDATSFLTYSSLAGLLVLISKGANSDKISSGTLFVSFLVGILLGLQFFIKFPPTVLAWIAFPLIIHFFLKDHSLTERIKVVASFVIGNAISFIAFFFAYGSPASWVGKQQQELGIVDQDMLDIFSFYLIDLPTVVTLIIGLITGFICFRISKNSFKNASIDRLQSVSLLIGTLLALTSAFLISDERFMDGVLPTITVLMMFLLTPIVIVVFQRHKVSSSPLNFLLFASLLLLLPMANMLGTRGPLTETIFQYIVPVFAISGYSINMLAKKLEWKAFPIISIVGVLIITQISLVQFQMKAPWQMDKPYSEHTKKTVGVSSLYLTPEESEFYQELGNKLNRIGYNEGDPIIAFDFMPGVLYQVKGFSPLVPFFLPGLEERADESNCYYLNKLNSEHFSKPPLVMFRVEPNIGTMECLNESILDFRNSYALAFKLKSPFQGDLKYLLSPEKFSHLYVYKTIND